MGDFMRESLKKLALWYTRTFKPLMTHQELEPIMATLGFTGLPPSPAPNGVVWKDYIYAAAGRRTAGDQAPGPRPRLPYHRIDALHIYTYHAFIDAVKFYLETDDISDLFHIRGMPLHPVYDRNNKFRRMDTEDNIFVYRDGSLDPSTYALYHVDKNATTTNKNENPFVYRNKSKTSTTVGTIVPLKDIIV